MATQGIYAIWHRESGRCYVGSSVNIERRWKEHKQRLNSGVHPCVHLQRAHKLYGPEAFSFSILEIIDLSSEAVRISHEQLWIDRLKPAFNHAPVAGSLLGLKKTEETRARMSAAQRHRYVISPTKLKGRSRPTEVRLAISSGRKGMKFSEEHIRNMSAALKGRVSPRKGVRLSEETKARISASKRAKYLASHGATL